jgi:hypothetical protein
MLKLSVIPTKLISSNFLYVINFKFHSKKKKKKKKKKKIYRPQDFIPILYRGNVPIRRRKSNHKTKIKCYPTLIVTDL